MSGESTRQSASPGEDLERAFGEKASCNRCGMRWPGYRVIVSFFHDLAAVRAYCPTCYEVAVEGEYHAAGDGLLLAVEDYARRFGNPGAASAPTAINRLLAQVVRDPALRELVPGTEAAARRLGHVPYRFLVEMEVEGEPLDAVVVIEPDGRVQAVEGDPPLRDRLQALIGSASS